MKNDSRLKKPLNEGSSKFPLTRLSLSTETKANVR